MEALSGTASLGPFAHDQLLSKRSTASVMETNKLYGNRNFAVSGPTE